MAMGGILAAEPFLHSALRRGAPLPTHPACMADKEIFPQGAAEGRMKSPDSIRAFYELLHTPKILPSAEINWIPNSESPFFSYLVEM